MVFFSFKSQQQGKAYLSTSFFEKEEGVSPTPHPLQAEVSTQV